MPCNLCGSEEYTVIYKEPLFMKNKSDEELSSYYSYSSIFLGGKKPHNQIVKCSSCGLVYSYPRRDDLLIRASYKNVEDACYTLTQEERRKKIQTELKEIKKYIDTGRILDVGCSTGIFLEEARLQGFDAYGVELSKWAFKKAESKGLKVFNSTLKEAVFPDKLIDVATMWDVLEHVTDPLGELKEIYRILSYNGILVLTTPDFSSFPSRLFGKGWQSISLQHIYYFTPETLEKMLSASGFSIIKRTTDSRITTMENILEYFKNRPLVYSLTRGLLKIAGIGKLKITVDPKDLMKVYARKTP